MGTTSDGIDIDFKFNIYGDLYSAGTSPSTFPSTITRQNTLAHYNSSVFTFQLVELNATDKTITVNFNGKVYDSQYDYTSAFTIVSGSFKLAYTVVAQSISCLGTFAKINGQDWHGFELISSRFIGANTTNLNVRT